ncbi:uncharacterized protein LOC143449349 isoform X1 [Clavelina lepadiformis]|uniref:uncharacterized protein LOC143449349 isoform X1 n=1 Tax=Clavelina lepadiformis TaxID=159417 RepID=UPI004041801D
MFLEYMLFMLLHGVITNAQDQAFNDSENHQSFHSQEASNNLTSKINQCQFVRGHRFSSQAKKLECCKSTVEEFERSWANFYFPLTSYLDTLRTWNCPQFKEECQRRLFAFTSFTVTVYEHFCNYEGYIERCFKEVKNIVKLAEERDQPRLAAMTPVTPQNLVTSSPVKSKPTNSSNIRPQWNVLIKKIQITHFSLDELLAACMQMAQYEVTGKQGDNFYEISSVSVPFCDVRWQGFSGDSLRKYPISRWTTFSTECRVSIGFIMAVCVILSIAITFVNVMVIIVLLRMSDHNRNSYVIFRLSLAIADLIVGVIVLPTCIYNLERLTMEPLEPEKLIRGADKFEIHLAHGYLQFVGFVTAVSLFVSLYTLTAAGCDRLVAIYRPLTYYKAQTKKVALWASIVAWLLAATFASLPLYVSFLRVRIILWFMVTIVGRLALILLPVAFGIPLLALWVLSIATSRASKRLSRFRKELSTDAENRARLMEVRITRTLALMVGVFSLSVLPVFVLLIISNFFPTLLLQLPRQVNINSAAAFLDVEFVSAIFLLSNSLWNFFIYNHRNVDFQNDVKYLLRSALSKTGIPSCCDATILCFQRLAYQGRRRLSSLPTLPLYNPRKKSSSTDVTGAPSAAEMSISDQPSVFHSPVDRRRNQTENKVSSMKLDDSVFNSVVIDIGANRMLESVMEKIDEEILPNFS